MLKYKRSKGLKVNMANANIKAVITADDRASDALKKFGHNVDSMGHAVGNALKMTALAAVAAGGAAVAFGVSSVKSYMESEDALAQLNATLTSTGGVAGVTSKAAVDLADSLQKVTKYSDEDVLAAENLLLTFTKIGQDIFPEATKTVLDMSTALGQDTKSSAIQLGKALQDPILGVTALRRVGVNFNSAQQDVIKNLVETGRSAEAQRLILKELATEFGGSAEAAGKTFGGRLEILKNQFDEVKESIGLAIVNGLTPLMTKLSTFVSSDQFQAWLDKVINWLSINLPIAIDYVVNTLVPNLINIFNQLWPVVQIAVEWFGKFVKFLADNEPALWTFIGVLGVMKAAFLINDAVIAFQGSMIAIKAAYTAAQILLSTPIPIVIATAAALYALWEVRKSIQDTFNEWDRTDKAIAGMKASQSDARARLEQLVKNGTPQQKATAAEQLRKGTAAGSFATGGYTGRGGMNDLAGVVHKGEYVVPQSQVNQRTGTPKMGGVNVTIQAGAFMGSQQDARRYAQIVADALKDVAKMNGTTVGSMLA
jgi:hypothetical protein